MTAFACVLALASLISLVLSRPGRPVPPPHASLWPGSIRRSTVDSESIRAAGQSIAVAGRLPPQGPDGFGERSDPGVVVRGAPDQPEGQRRHIRDGDQADVVAGEHRYSGRG